MREAAFGRLFHIQKIDRIECNMTNSATSSLGTRFVFPGHGNAIFVILILALTVNFLFSTGHDSQRCFEVAALCMVAALMVGRICMGWVIKLPKISTPLLAIFFILGLLSALQAYSLRHAVYEWTCFLLLLALVFSFASELAQDMSRVDKLLHWVGIACGLYSLRILIMYAAALASGYQPDWTDLTVGFSNLRFLNHTQTSLLPLLVLLCIKASPSNGWRKVWFTLIAFWWALLFVTEARATILALSVGCTVALMVRRSQARHFVETMAFAAIAGLIIYALCFILLPLLFSLQPLGLPANVLERTVANPTSDRSYLWKLATHSIASHPWLGVGPQHFAHEGATLYKGAHPHNFYLQIAAEWGIPALLCLASVLVLSARVLARAGARLAAVDLANQQILTTLIVAGTAILIDALFSGSFVMPQSQLAIALVFSIGYAWVSHQEGTASQLASRQSALKRGLMAGLIIAAVYGLIWSVAPDFVRHAKKGALTPAELTANPETHWSRMWEAGYF